MPFTGHLQKGKLWIKNFSNWKEESDLCNLKSDVLKAFRIRSRIRKYHINWSYVVHTHPGNQGNWNRKVIEIYK